MTRGFHGEKKKVKNAPRNNKRKEVTREKKSKTNMSIFKCYTYEIVGHLVKCCTRKK